MREYKLILALIILTALLSGIIYFKFPAIMGAHTLSVALWAVLCAEILAFIKR